MTSLLRRLALPAALVLATAGCSAFSDEAGPGDGGGQVGVAAAFYPLAWVAEEVGGDHVTVHTLTAPGGGDPHDQELTIEATAALADADLVLHSAGFQPAVDDGVAQNAQGAVVDAAEVVGLAPADDEHAHEDPEEHAGHDHGDGADGTDPHFWLDPLRMAELGDEVGEQLSAVDPEHAADYRAAADDLREQLTALDTAYAEGLASCERDTVVVSHDAFGYLARYGLHFEAVAGLSPDAEPTPAALARLHDLIREEGLTTVFSERLASPRLTESLAEDAGVTTAVLDPIEGLTAETADEDYLSLMRANLAALQEANGCR